MHRRFGLLVGAALVFANIFPAGATATTFSRSVTVTQSPKNVTQGARFTVTVRVGSPTQAKTVQIEARTQDIYGNTTWTVLKSQKVRATAKHTFKLLATGVDTQRYRARATYRTGKPVIDAFSVTVWQWTDLHRVSSYYSTAGVAANAYSQLAMNGDQYIGWYTYGSYGMWETRYTPGRSCKAFRGILGVTDASADGSSAEFTLLTDESSVVYTSSSLVPGMVETMQIPIANPYRFSIQARNTSPGGLRGYPAIGNPQFLCNTAF